MRGSQSTASRSTKTWTICSELYEEAMPGRLASHDNGDELAVELDAEESKLDGFHEECGVFGVYGHPEAANLAYLGLYALAASRAGIRGHRLVQRQVADRASRDGPGRRHFQ